MTLPSTDDTPRLYVARPDWASGVLTGLAYRTEVVRGRKGLEQRAQKRKLPIDTISYQSDQQPNYEHGIDGIEASSRGTLHVPWWSHGIQIRVDMAAATTVGILHEPLITNWCPEDLVWIESESQQGELRQVASILDNNITLVDEGGHTNYVAEGGWVYPVVKAVRAAQDDMLRQPTQYARTETISLRRL